MNLGPRAFWVERVEQEQLGSTPLLQMKRTTESPWPAISFAQPARLTAHKRRWPLAEPSSVLVRTESARAADVHFRLRRAVRARWPAVVTRGLATAIRSALRTPLAAALEGARRTVEAAL